MHATRLSLDLPCIFLTWAELSSLSCSDMLDKAIDTLEQRILDVEADIESAESEAKRAQAGGTDEDLRFWRTKEQQLRTKEQQLRTKEQQLRDERAKKELLQQGVSLHPLTPRPLPHSRGVLHHRHFLA